MNDRLIEYSSLTYPGVCSCVLSVPSISEVGALNSTVLIVNFFTYLLYIFAVCISSSLLGAYTFRTVTSFS